MRKMLTIKAAFEDELDAIRRSATTLRPVKLMKPLRRERLPLRSSSPTILR